MNIALAALSLFLLALPGILFRLTYRRISPETPVRLQLVVEETAIGITFAALIHFCFLGVLGFVTGLFEGLSTLSLDKDDFRHLLALIAGETGEAQRRALNAVAGSFWPTALYLIMAALVGGLLGLCARMAVRSFGLDLRYKWFRFPDPWYYLLSGEDAALNKAISSEAASDGGGDIVRLRRLGQIPKGVKRSNILERVKEIDAVHATVIVQQGEEVLMYGGVLSKCFYSKGQLDRIVLLSSYRLPLPKTWEARHENTFKMALTPLGKRALVPEVYPISAEALVIDYVDIKTLAVRCYRLTTRKSTPQDDLEMEEARMASALPVLTTPVLDGQHGEMAEGSEGDASAQAVDV